MMRILCLHGTGTNNTIFAAQTAALRKSIEDSDHYTFDFVEGAMPWAPAKEIAELSSEDMEFFAYYDTFDVESVSRAVDDLVEYVESEGPFSGVMGFSQGATLAAMLLARDSMQSMMSFGIFICGAQPFSIDWLRKGVLRLEEDERVKVPTVHILGAKDVSVEYSRRLIETCCKHSRVVYDHGGGHEIPSKPKEVTEEMATAIRKTIAKAMFVQ